MTNSFFYSTRCFALAALAVLSATAVNAQQTAPQSQNLSNGAAQLADAPIALSAEQIVTLQSQWKAGRNQFSVATQSNVAQSNAAQFGASDFGANDLGAKSVGTNSIGAKSVGTNSRVKTPEALASSLPPLEARDALLAGDGSPVVALHNRDERGRRDYDNDYNNDRRGNRWYGGNGNTIVLYLGQRFVDPSGRIIILGNNNTIIINQPSAYPTYGYPTYGYPSYGYPGYGYGHNAGYPYNHGYPSGYGYGTSYGSLGTGIAPVYNYGNGANHPQSGYNSHYGNANGGWNYNGGSSGYSYGNSYSNGAYSTRSNTTTSGWMNAPGTISSTTFPAYPSTFPAYPDAYPGAIYSTRPQTVFQSNDANIRLATPSVNTPMHSYSPDNTARRASRR